MQSIYLNDICNNKKKEKDILNKKFNYLYVPFIGIIENINNIKNIIPKTILDNSRLFYGNNKIYTNNLFNIQFEGNTKIMSNNWFIKYISSVIHNYNEIFQTLIHVPKKIYIQIIQYNKNNNNFIGGLTSYNGIEIILSKNIHKNPIIIKQLLAHELLHLYFPSIYSNKSACYNEGFLDYLSVILNFTKKNVLYLTNHKINEYNYLKSLNNNKYLQQEIPYIIGYLNGFILDKLIIDKIINFIKKYVKNRKYMIIPWNNKKYIEFIKNNLFSHKLCKTRIVYNI